MQPSELAPAVRTGHATQFSLVDGRATAIERALPVETPVAIVYLPAPYAVMLASPMDLEDFAYGFSLCEGVITQASDIRAVDIEPERQGLRLTITLTADRLGSHLARRRSMAGQTGCGICGIEELDQLPFARPRPPGGSLLSLAAARRAIRALDARLPLGALTRATHAAAWCDEDGDIRWVLEDVGRHNALDKLIGALLRAGVDATRGFVLVTSRCSFEMVEKTAAFGAPAIVSVSAPTSLAVERAEAHGMALLAVARSDGAMLFTAGASVDNDLQAEGARRA
jgi:FdhD protein